MSSLEERHGKLAQLHPEDLLDKAEEGTLTAEERVRLDAHVAQCHACRMEQLLRADFEADEGGDRISYSSLVEGALGVVANDVQHEKDRKLAAEAARETRIDAPSPRAEERAHGPAAEKAVAVVRPTRGAAGAPWKRFALLLAAAFVLLATGAFASEQGRALARRATSMFTAEDRTREKEVSAQKPLAPAPKALEVAHAPEVPAAPAAPSPVESDPVVAAPVSPPQGPLVTSPVAPARVAPLSPSTPVAGNPRAAPEATAALSPAAPEALVAPTPPEPQDAASLFSSANDKRRAGNVAGALAAYGELVTRFPASREAATAHALRGRIFLEQREARRALSEFDAYLATGRGELREEAMIGRARAFGMLGQSDGERTAWQSVLAAFPSSASAEHARLRLDALAGR